MRCGTAIKPVASLLGGDGGERRSPAPEGHAKAADAPVDAPKGPIAAQTDPAAMAPRATLPSGMPPEAALRPATSGPAEDATPSSAGRIMTGGLTVALLRATPSAVVAMDIEGHITMLNAAAERLLSTTSQQAIGRPYPEVFGPSLSSRMINLYLRVARSADPGQPQIMQATLPDGRRVTLRANAGPLHDSAGTLIGILFVAEEPVQHAGMPDAADRPASRERHLRQALQAYVGDAIAARVADHPSFIGVGGVRQTISVLHADVRGYTTLAEALEPEQVSSLLVRYHGAAVAALLREGATIDRYIGDAILAMWNAPAPQPDHARRALRGALAMRAATQALGTDLEYGIGLHTGEAIVGNIGSDSYMHYTAIGDTVNVAARLQSAAPAGGIICSAVTLAAAGGGARTAALGPLFVKGRKNPVDAFRVEGIDA